MKERGRPRKPTALKLLEGDTSHGRSVINENEPKPQQDKIRCPMFLTPDAKKKWRELEKSLKAMGVLTNWDTTAFTMYCNAYATWREAQRHLQEEGYTTFTATGGVKASPWVQISDSQVRIMMDISRDFGLTPSSRAKLNTAPDEAEDSDPMAKVLGGGWQ